jgi:hypothetical protein
LLETAIQRYHDAYGFYPPGNPNNAVTNQLYFELLGTTNINVSTGIFQTLDGSVQINVGDANSAFGVSGFMNCSKPNGDESSGQAKDFLSDLKPNQSMVLFTNGVDVVKILVGSVGGPDQTYSPLGSFYSGLNPWRYKSPGVNNPKSYDLWMQLVIAGQTNLVCNWSGQVQINSPLP